MNVIDVLNSFSDYFVKSVGINKFFNSRVTFYDLFVLFIALGVLLFLAAYFSYPLWKKYILNRKLKHFIFFYKDLRDDEIKTLKRLGRKHRIDPFYRLLISRATYDKVFASEIKSMMLAQESETRIKDLSAKKSEIHRKLFSKSVS